MAVRRLRGRTDRPEAATNALTSAVAPLPHYRGQPSALIATIVVAMARQLDLSESEIDRLKIAALLHDVGKVALPEDILEKPSALTSAEWRTVVQHPRIGQVILEQAAALKDSVPIILHHHERFAGHGYPYGLRGSEIPMGARIVAIADAYDAMVNDRPYKRAMSHADAIESSVSMPVRSSTRSSSRSSATCSPRSRRSRTRRSSPSMPCIPTAGFPQLVAADGLTPTVSGPRVARPDRAATSSGMSDTTARPAKPARGQIRSAGDPGQLGPGPSALREETSTAAAEAQVRMALTDTGSGPPTHASDTSDSPSSDRSRGFVSG